ncbi:MAG: hypothetical protein CVV34_01365 [Methanomicrobiales archaeon HGW-Methanomicrobiales-5]|nr:MAG: hypothetical protein CVV34_01365 [Methanomicrobiales archaeon HGW-Methanomicrobiales-5]
MKMRFLDRKSRIYCCKKNVERSGIFLEQSQHNGNEHLFQDLKITNIMVIDPAKTFEKVSSARVPGAFQHLPFSIRNGSS